MKNIIHLRRAWCWLFGHKYVLDEPRISAMHDWYWCKRCGRMRVERYAELSRLYKIAKDAK